MVPSMVNDLYIVRFAVCAKHATDDDMHVAFRIIQEHAGNVIAEYHAQRARRQSSSADSLELANKQTSMTNLEQQQQQDTTVVPEETIKAEVIPETKPAAPLYPIIKVRVNNSN